MRKVTTRTLTVWLPAYLKNGAQYHYREKDGANVVRRVRKSAEKYLEKQPEQDKFLVKVQTITTYYE